MLLLVRLFLTLQITISFSNEICKQSLFHIIMVSIITIHTNAAVIMTMAIVVIKKYTHCMSIATKNMTKFLKKFKKTIFVAFSR